MPEPACDSEIAPKRVSSEAIRHRLILAAERVVAHRGFAGVTVREIHAAAGARNTSAVNYHFGSLEALLAAVFEYRSAPLDISDSTAGPNVEQVVSALVRALATFLKPSPDGNYYLRFLERALIEQRLARSFVPKGIIKLWDDAEGTILRLLKGEFPDRLVEIRIAFSRSHFISALAQIEVWISSDSKRAVLLPMLVQTVIDSTLSMLTAPLSQNLEREITALSKRDLALFEAY